MKKILSVCFGYATFTERHDLFGDDEACEGERSQMAEIALFEGQSFCLFPKKFTENTMCC